MDSDWESSFEFVSEAEPIIQRRLNAPRNDNTQQSVTANSIESSESHKKEAIKQKNPQKKIRFENLCCEVLGIISFAGYMFFMLYFIDLFDVTMQYEMKKIQQLVSFENQKSGITRSNYYQNVDLFIEGIKQNRKDHEITHKYTDFTLYTLSEIEPIEVSLRRDWIARPQYFVGVQEFVREMGWEGTFEEDLFVHGVPNFDDEFELEENTLKTTLNGKHYNHKFLNLGTKETIGKQHSVEFFVSGRSLIRLVMHDGVEFLRTEYYLKFGDLHIYDRHKGVESIRVYHSPSFNNKLIIRLTKT